jgi:hypothetical protein
MAPSQSYGPVSLPADTTVQQQAQAVVGEVAETVADALDLLIWNGAVKWEPPVSSSCVSLLCWRAAWWLG